MRNTTYDVLGGRPTAFVQPGAPSAAIALGSTLLRAAASYLGRMGAATWTLNGVRSLR
jgi:hypothetical protein